MQMQNNMITSWDDGSVFDLKIAELLDRYKISAIFYIPIINHEREVMTKSQIRQIAYKFEVGGHTYSHVDLTTVSQKKAFDEVLKGKKELEDIIGKKINKFCFPKGRYNKNVVGVVKKAGFKSARTSRIFCIDNNYGGFLENPNLHVYNHMLITYLASCVKNKDLKSFLSALRIKRVGFSNVASQFYRQGFHIWGHSWEVEEKVLWKDLKNFLSKLSKFNYN